MRKFVTFFESICLSGLTINLPQDTQDSICKAKVLARLGINCLNLVQGDWIYCKMLSAEFISLYHPGSLKPS